MAHKLTVIRLENTTRSGTYVYAVKGDAESLKAYKAAKGAYYRENDDKEPLYFTRGVIAAGTEMEIDASGNRVPVKASAEEQAIVDGLAKFSKVSVNDAQKYAALKAAGLVA